MKHLVKKIEGKVFLTVLMLFTCVMSVLAQNGGSTTTTRVEQSVTVQPWVWIVGAAVFILILVAILRGGKGRDVTITKTTTNSDI
jgi:heme/copper-type cytochrome/quinol oxidase subunit 2